MKRELETLVALERRIDMSLGDAAKGLTWSESKMAKAYLRGVIRGLKHSARLTRIFGGQLVLQSKTKKKR